MKAVLQAGWLLTVAVGNFIVLIVAEIAKLPKQVNFDMSLSYRAHSTLPVVTTGINVFDNTFVSPLFSSSHQVDWVHPVCLSVAGGVHHLLHYGIFLHVYWPCRNWGSVQEPRRWWRRGLQISDGKTWNGQKWPPSQRCFWSDQIVKVSNYDCINNLFYVATWCEQFYYIKCNTPCN